MNEPIFNHDKFAEMLLYVVSQVEHDYTNGDTKLNKLLYYADVTAYRKTGRAISGARYKHQTHGPIAIALWPVREELEEQERLKVSEKRLPNNAVQRRTYALDEADADLFDDGELEIVDEVIKRFRGCKADEMAAFAHEEPAWRITEDEEEMTYRSCLLVRNPTPAAAAFGGRLAGRLGL